MFYKQPCWVAFTPTKEGTFLWAPLAWVVSTPLVYCNTVRHRDIAVKLHSHFCKHHPVRPSSPGCYPAHPLLAGYTPLLGFDVPAVGDLAWQDQGLLWRQVAQNAEGSQVGQWHATAELFSFSLDVLWDSSSKRHRRTPDPRLSRKQTFPRRQQ